MSKMKLYEDVKAGEFFVHLRPKRKNIKTDIYMKLEDNKSTSMDGDDIGFIWTEWSEGLAVKVVKRKLIKENK